MTIRVTILILLFCAPNCILNAIEQTWPLGIDGAEKVSEIVTKDRRAIADKNGLVLAFLASDEVVKGFASNGEKKLAVLKIDHKIVGPGGEIVQYYSRLLWVFIGKNGMEARSLLPYDGDFLMKNRMSVSKIISISEDGLSILAACKVSVNGKVLDIVRKIDPFTPKFIDE